MAEIERREHRRNQVDSAAEIFVQGQPYPCRIRDISEGGFFVTTEFFFPIGEKILITARDVQMIEKTGRTVRIDLTGIGGKFDEKGVSRLATL